MMRRIIALLTVLALAPAGALADTLYQAPPPPAGPGHPLRLGPDVKAAQIGDLVYVQFDFNSSSSHLNNYTSSKQFAIGPGAATGTGGTVTNPPVINHLSISDAASTSTQQQAAAADVFNSTMMATVIGVLPSGALELEGDQAIQINGRLQTLTITGTVRPADIDNTDTVLGSRVANVHATFKGDDWKNKGLLARILSWLF
jgi:flagellar L-ring protein FlgH